MCDRVGMPRRGRAAEQGDAEAVLDARVHAHTREPMAVVPADQARGARIAGFTPA